MSFPLVEKLSSLAMKGMSFSMEWIIYSQILPLYKIVTESLRHSQNFLLYKVSIAVFW